MRRVAVVAAVVLLIAGAYLSGLDELLTLEGLRGARAALQGRLAATPVAFAAAFFVLYVAVTAVSVPGATVMTLAAGALFGLGWGTLIVSFASSLGATLAFLASRYVLRETVERRFGKALQTVNAGVERDGVFYLLTLRLVPLFPFFAINLLFGLTRMRAGTFYGVSQLGMLAGTVVYVNAGTELARVSTLADVGSVRLLGAFALLALFPWLARAGLRGWQASRVYARWQRPASFDRNLVVIGAGSAGLVTAYVAAAVRAKVTLIEANRMGGDCLNYGCVPSKALLRSAKLASEMRHAERYGLVSCSPEPSFRAVMARVHAIVKSIEPHDSVERYTSLGVEVIQGRARLVDPWTVEVKDGDASTMRLTARSIVLATGARPIVPAVPGIEQSGYVTSDTVWERFAELDEAPRRLIVLGGGPIGCELAQAFARLGSSVTQVEMAARLMAREDEDAAEVVRASLEHDGVTVLTRHKAVRCEIGPSNKALVVEQDGRERRIEFDELLCAVGRAARLEGYGLELLGISTKRTIVTNEYLETIYPNILAAGDVAGPYQFTHTASHQAWYAAVNALFGGVKRFKVDYSVIPWTTFVDPEVARVGLNEQEARERNVPYEVTRFDLAELDRAIAESATQGFVKVLTQPKRDKILGVTIVGAHGGELLAEFVLAMKHGLGLNKILGTIHTYPTLAEANKYAAGQWRRAHAPDRLLRWAERFHAWRRG